jgi:serine/threonine-protein kinase
VGTRFAEFETLVELGRGGMGDLFVARAAGAGPDAPLVIVKTMRPPNTEKRLNMFLDEARLGVLFRHPNVVQTLRVGEEAGRHFIAMEYLDGQPVDRLLQRTHRTEDGRPREAHLRSLYLWILAEGLAGLHYAHDLSNDGVPLNIVHRDFTPQNLFVKYDGGVKTLDFGIAKATGRASQTTTGEVKGKVRYMAPEQALGLRIDRRVDIFAAGVMLWELYTGSPFWEKTLKDDHVFDELIGGTYPVEIPGEPDWINDILRRSLARDAARRYRTAGEMRMDVVAAIEQCSPLEQPTRALSGFVSELFEDQRHRTANMLAHAAATRDKPPAK